MRKNYVEICGVDTSKLITLKEEKKRELLIRCKAGDKAAREELILGNLRLVLSIVGKFTPKNESASDLFQVGCIGLIKAIDNFNTELDVRFSTYAVPMIIGEIRRHMRDNNSVRISRSMRDLAYRALQVKEDICARHGRDATIAEIATALGETEAAVGAAMEAIVEPASLYDSIFSDGGEDSMYVIDKVASEGGTGDEDLVESISLREALKRLGEREMGIISRRFFKGRTQMEIADEIGISQAQVSRLEKGAIEKLRKYMS
ncbi:MAG: SigB/SigF/SigG family RNA polymerase sigma factor [Clostridia bacterium]|nr:SigB/SigF/SigG family RNA polymerase sigma factor [Clostridia bacterium]